MLLCNTPDFKQRCCVVSTTSPPSPANTPSQLLAISHHTTSSKSGDLLQHQHSEDTDRLQSLLTRL